MEVNVQDTKTVDVKSIKMCVKVSDRFRCHVKGQEGEILETYEGYVPDFFPEDHFGDYIELEIDLETGKIMNWCAPTSGDLECLFEQE